MASPGPSRKLTLCYYDPGSTAPVSCASCCRFMSASTLSTSTSSCAWRYLPTHPVDAAHLAHVELGLPHGRDAHFRWQTLDILLNKSVIISISIFAAVNLARRPLGVVLEPPLNQDMVLLRLYVAPPRWWIDWRRVDGVSLRLPRSRGATERRGR